jgi:hypothetical protein
MSKAKSFYTQKYVKSITDAAAISLDRNGPTAGRSSLTARALPLFQLRIK